MLENKKYNIKAPDIIESQASKYINNKLKGVLPKRYFISFNFYVDDFCEIDSLEEKELLKDLLDIFKNTRYGLENYKYRNSDDGITIKPIRREGGLEYEKLHNSLPDDFINDEDMRESLLGELREFYIHNRKRGDRNSTRVFYSVLKDSNSIFYFIIAITTKERMGVS